jgi:serine/threonine-protein kinase
MRQLGRYVVSGEIGRGAMGIVFRGQDPTIGRPVAIKTLNPAALTDPAHEEMLRTRLMREAQSAALLSHPGIVTLYDVIEAEGMACLVMEYVDGQTLASLLQHGRLRTDVALDLISKIAAALDYAHRTGVIHRDIKPANILVTRDGLAKIADFGVARISSRETTVGLRALGTPGYIAPEQIRDEPASNRSDQFAFAVLAFELLAHRKPFDSEQVSALIYKILHEPPPPTGLGAAVDQVFAKALAKQPAERFDSCSAFAAALRSTVLPTVTPPPAPAVGLGTTTTQNTVSASAPSASSVDVRWVALAAVVVMGLMAAGVWALRSDRQQEQKAKVVMPAPVVEEGARAAEEPDAQKTAPQQQEPDPSPPPPPPPPPEKRVRETAQAKPVQPKPAATVTPKAPPAAAAVNKSGKIRVATTPPGARLVFDNDPLLACESPCEREFAAGSHGVTVILDGHRVVNTRFDIPGIPDLTIVLQKLEGVIAFDASLQGARVFVDGRELPSSAPTESTLSVGPHQVRVVVGEQVVMDRTLTVRASGRILVRAPAATPPARPAAK